MNKRLTNPNIFDYLVLGKNKIKVIKNEIYFY